MRNVLIISNNDELCSELAGMLRRAGYSHIYSSCDFEEIFSMAYRLDFKFIVADMNFPPGALANLSKIFSGPMRKNILFITPPSGADEKILALTKKGCSHFVRQPIEEPIFLKKVTEIVGTND